MVLLFIFDLHLVVVSSFHFLFSFCCCVFICRCSSFCCCFLHSHFLFDFCKRYGLKWGCFTYRRFLPYAPSDILTCVYQGFSGSRQLFLEICRASSWSSKHRPGPSVCFIHRKDVIEEGLTSLNISIIKFYDFYLFHYIHWNKACNAFQWIWDNYASGMLYVSNHNFSLFRLLKYY